MDQAAVPVEAAARMALIRRGVRQEPLRHERLREVYGGELRESEEASLPRQDRVNLPRFRTGHHPSLGRWRAMVGRTEDPHLSPLPDGGGEFGAPLDGVWGLGGP